jgi:hypothetical protein
LPGWARPPIPITFTYSWTCKPPPPSPESCALFLRGSAAQYTKTMLVKTL